MKVVTAEEMASLERAANDSGLGYEEMMESAGRAAAQAIKERIAGSSQILVLVGPGNNGGDGLIAARYLHEWAFPVTVYVWKRSQDPDPNLARVEERHIPILWADDDAALAQLSDLVGRCDALVDALLGTGTMGALRGNLPALLDLVSSRLATRRVRRERGPLSAPIAVTSTETRERCPLIVAVDLPTGLNSDTGEVDPHALTADLTVTFTWPKRGHLAFPGARHVGQLLVADIGIPSSLADQVLLEVATPEKVAALLPARPLDAHKGSFGKALIIGGSVNYVGAPCLAAQSAYRSGAGLVTLAVAHSIFSIVAAKLTEPTYLVLPDDMGALVPEGLRLLAERLGDCDALLVGPGLGTEPATKAFLLGLLAGQEHTPQRTVGFLGAQAVAGRQFALPSLVLDADALNMLAGEDGWWENLPNECVLTPHPGEMARLLKCGLPEVQADRLGVARVAAQAWRCVVVLKGAYTVVASPDGRATIIPFANPALATAGTGDVLAGAVLGLLAQGLSAHDAAVCGAYLHGMAAELWRGKMGSAGMIASDLLTRLPVAMNKLLGQ